MELRQAQKRVCSIQYFMSSMNVDILLTVESIYMG